MADKALQPHAVLDLPSRAKKGAKIAEILQLSSRPSPIRLLEIGTGSGGIAHHFGTHPGLSCEVTAVDVCDQRQVRGGYRFVPVEGVQLPFEDAHFDVVITNHVIEHVGDRNAQAAHLREVRRVLAPSGIGYLAVPNRWMLVEPHYRLAFLSWWPEALRSPYLRWMGKGSHYDCRPLTQPQLDGLLEEAGLGYRHVEVEALGATLRLESGHSRLAFAVARLPAPILRALTPIIPTLICTLWRAPDAQ